MKFSPGDIAWVRHWSDLWSEPDSRIHSDWRLAAWDGVEQVVTVVRYVEKDGILRAEVMGSDGISFITPDDYLVDEKTALRMRREGLLNNFNLRP